MRKEHKPQQESEQQRLVNMLICVASNPWYADVLDAASGAVEGINIEELHEYKTKAASVRHAVDIADIDVPRDRMIAAAELLESIGLLVKIDDRYHLSQHSKDHWQEYLDSKNLGGNERRWLNREQIESVLPHKGESLFLDEAIVIHGETATATLAHIPLLEQHGIKEVPNFIVFDAMAQTLTLVNPPQDGLVGMLTGINEMQITRKVKITEKVTLEARVVNQRGNVGRGHVLAKVGDEIVAEGTYSFAIIDTKVRQLI